MKILPPLFSSGRTLAETIHQYCRFFIPGTRYAGYIAARHPLDASQGYNFANLSAYKKLTETSMPQRQGSRVAEWEMVGGLTRSPSQTPGIYLLYNILPTTSAITGYATDLP